MIKKKKKEREEETSQENLQRENETPNNLIKSRKRSHDVLMACKHNHT